MAQEELAQLREAARDDADAQYRLGMRYVYGDAVPEDYGLAIDLLSKAAAQGHVEATYNLAICYHYGYGTAVDLERAYALYLTSANKGYAKGRHLVGRFHYFGWHVRQDYGEAIKWFEASARLHDPTIMGFNDCYLGACYARGYGVEADPAKAEELFARAVADGGEHAAKLIQTLLK